MLFFGIVAGKKFKNILIKLSYIYDPKSYYWKVYHFNVYCINTVLCVLSSASDFVTLLYTFDIVVLTYIYSFTAAE